MFCQEKLLGRLREIKQETEPAINLTGFSVVFEAYQENVGQTEDIMETTLLCILKVKLNGRASKPCDEAGIDIKGKSTKAVEMH